MVLISHVHKFIYLKNYKVAGSSVESFFGQFCIDPKKKDTYSFEDKQDEQITQYGILGHRNNGKVTIWHNDKCAKDIKNDLGNEIFDNYFKFCVVRNPYDLIVSSYFFEHIKTDFKTYCTELNSKHLIKIRDNDLTRTFLNDAPVCQYYIRYENLTNDILTVLKKLGIKDFDIKDLPKHKSSGIRPKNKSYKEYYDDETREIAKRIFHKEIEMFKYEF